MLKNHDFLIDTKGPFASFSGSRCEDVAINLFLSSKIKCGPKGLTALFASVQRRMREGFINDYQQSSTFRELAVVREKLFQQTVHRISESLSQGNAKDFIIPNGRVCDAILRCYVDDCNKAKDVLKVLISLGTKAETIHKGVLLEIAEKSMEALMFVAGINYRPGTNTDSIARVLFT